MTLARAQWRARIREWALGPAWAIAHVRPQAGVRGCGLRRHLRRGRDEGTRAACGRVAVPSAEPASGRGLVGALAGRRLGVLANGREIVGSLTRGRGRLAARWRLAMLFDGTAGPTAMRRLTLRGAYDASSTAETIRYSPRGSFSPTISGR